MDISPALRVLIEGTIDRPVPAPIRAMATAARAEFPGTVAVLAYGSSLRGEDPRETLIDLYALTRGASGMSRLSRLACALVPPNVYHLEAEHGGHRYRAKCAVVALDRFARRMAPDIANPYFWARFAQPSALLHSATPGDREQVISALARALTTAYGHGLGLGAEGTDGFARLFAETYRTELRSEAPGRALDLVMADAAYYGEAAGLLIEAPPLRANWPLRRAAGKALSIVRLMKAAFTFAGGADYLAWKIARHSGTPLALSPWQRRHPLLAGVMLLPKLLRKGAVR